MDLPVPADAPMPAWLGHPETSDSAFATLNLPVLSPSLEGSLLVTVFFEEKQGGFLRVIWKGTQGSQILSENFYEGIGMTNQRSLLIPAATMVGDGTLVFQSSGMTLGIQRIKLEWLAPKQALVSPDVVGQLVAPAVGATQAASTLNGANAAGQSAAWQDDIVTVPLSDTAMRIEQGVEFSIDLDKVPGHARLALKESGLPLGQRIVVWVNQQRAGTITPAVPDLLDDGYSVNMTTAYTGWRDGSFFIPVSLLKSGENSVQFSQEDDASSTLAKAVAVDTDTPLAVKSVQMQLDYQSSSPITPATSGHLDLNSPTGPIMPSSITVSTTSSAP